VSNQFTYVNDGVNKDAETFDSKYQLHKGVLAHFSARHDLLDTHEGVHVIRGDKIPGGLKYPPLLDYVYNLDVQTDHFVYVTPKIGYATVALALACKALNKKLSLFSPATKNVGWGQVLPHIYYGNINHYFIRVAALKNLRAIARKWCEKHGAHYVPFGLTNTPAFTNAFAATLALIVSANQKRSDSPVDLTGLERIVCACSTGMLLRASMLAFNQTKHTAVLVCRNMQAGEVGNAKVISTPYPWLKSAKILPSEFDTVATYDGKAWEMIVKTLDKKPELRDKIMFLNVARDLTPGENERVEELKSKMFKLKHTDVPWRKVGKIIRQ